VGILIPLGSAHAHTYGGASYVWDSQRNRVGRPLTKTLSCIWPDAKLFAHEWEIDALKVDFCDFWFIPSQLTLWREVSVLPIAQCTMLPRTPVTMLSCYRGDCQVYKGQGWEGYGHFLGTGNVHDQSHA